MKYRAEVIVLLMAMVFVTTGISVGISVLELERLLRDQMGSQMLSVAATTAAFLDGDLHKAIKAPGDETFRRLRHTARRDSARARCQSPLTTSMSKYAYTLTVDPTEGRPDSVWRRCGGEHGDSRRNWRGPTARSSTIHSVSINTSMIRSSLRTTGANFLPPMRRSRTSEGNVVAALGVDVESSQVMRKTASILDDRADCARRRRCSLLWQSQSSSRIVRASRWMNCAERLRPSAAAISALARTSVRKMNLAWSARQSTRWRRGCRRGGRCCHRSNVTFRTRWSIQFFTRPSRRPSRASGAS